MSRVFYETVLKIKIKTANQQPKNDTFTIASVKLNKLSSAMDEGRSHSEATMPAAVLEAIVEFRGCNVEDVEVLNQIMELNWDDVRLALRGKFAVFHEPAFTRSQEEIDRRIIVERVILPLRLELARTRSLLQELNAIENHRRGRPTSEDEIHERARIVSRIRLQYCVSRLKCVYIWLSSDMKEIGVKIQEIMTLISRLVVVI